MGLWSRPQRGQGGGKGAEEQYFPGFTGLGGGKSTATCLLPVSGYGAEGCVMCAAYRLAHCPLQSNSPVRPQNNRGNTESKQAEKGSWLKQVGKNVDTYYKYQH